MKVLEKMAELDKMVQDGVKVSAADARKLYFEGAADGMQIAGMICPFDVEKSRQRERESWVMSQAMAYHSELRQKMQKDASLVIQRYGLPVDDLRGMLFDTERLDASGRELDENNRVISDCLGTMLSGETHRPWPLFEWTDRLGIVISSEDYEKRSEMEKKRFKKRRFFEIEGFDRIYSDDTDRLSELIKEDIRKGDRINLRYAVAATKRHELSQYNSTISQCLSERDVVRAHGEWLQMVMKQAVLGHISSEGMLNIAFLYAFCNLGVESFMQLNIEDYQRMEGLVQSALDGKFESLFTDLDLMTFRTTQNEHLPGLELADSACFVVTSVRDLDNCQRVEKRRAYLKHYLLRNAISDLADLLGADRFADLLALADMEHRGALLSLIQKTYRLLDRERRADLAIEERIDMTQVKLPQKNLNTALRLAMLSVDEAEKAEN